MNSVPDLHRQEKDEQNRETGDRSTVLTHVFNTGRDKSGTNQILIKSVHKSHERLNHQHRVNKKGKKGTWEATLTDVSNTQLKD